VTEFEGKGRDGKVYLLYLKVARRDGQKIIQDAKDIDSAVFYVIENIRGSSTMHPPELAYPTGWRAIQKKK